jgi:cytochrome bd-type quinol oxidase subunit 2
MTIGRRGRQFTRLSWAMLVTIPMGLVLLAMWQVVVDTSPTLNDEDRIRGWVSVWRELPATAFLIAGPVVGSVLAVMAGRRGDTASALRAIWMHGAALFFVLLVILNGSAETIMTTRASTVKWLLLPAQLGITGAVIAGARRAVRRGDRLGP